MTTISDERLAEMKSVLDMPIGAVVVKGSDLADLRSTLTELQSLRAQGGVRVKPLEWVRVTEPSICYGGEFKRYWKASDSLGGWVWVNVHSDDFDGEASWGGEKYPSSAAAMSAAEGHRRDRILSALEASPAPVSEEMVVSIATLFGNYIPGHGWTGFGPTPEQIEAALAAKGGY